MQSSTYQVGGFNSQSEVALLARQMVSEITKRGDHISLTLTGKGVTALARELLGSKTTEQPQSPAGLESKDSLLSRREVMEELSVSSTTLWLWEQKKYLIPLRIGRKVYYRKDDINALRGGK